MTASAGTAMIDTFAGNGDDGHPGKWPYRRVASLPPGRPAQIRSRTSRPSPSALFLP